MRWTPLSLGFRVRTAWRGGRNLSNCCLASLIVWITSFGSLPKYAKILGGSARVEKNREAEKYAHSDERAPTHTHTHTHTGYAHTHSHTSPPPLLFAGSPAQTHPPSIILTVIEEKVRHAKRNKTFSFSIDPYFFSKHNPRFKSILKTSYSDSNTREVNKILHAHKRNKRYTMRCQILPETQNGYRIIYKVESLSLSLSLSHC